MRKMFLLMTFFLFFYSEAISQKDKFEEQDKNAGNLLDAYPPDSYQIGINTQFIIDGILDQSIRTPIEILFRKQDKSNHAYRLRVSGIFQNAQRFELDYSNKTQQSNLGVAIGFEWQKMISKRWYWYYGLEVEARRFWYSDMEAYNVFDQYTQEDFHVKTENNQVINRLSLLPLVGFRFQITSRLYVNTEIKLEGFTEKQDNTNGFDVRSINGSSEFNDSSFEEFSIKEKHLNFQPFTGIFINFIL